MTEQPGAQQDELDVARVRTQVARFVQDRGDADVEDVVQESVARLLENQDRLTPDRWTPYAIVTARNLLVNRERRRVLASRHEHRLYDPEAVEGPEAGALLREEHAALDRAIRHLAPADRDLLIRQYGDGEGAGNRSISGVVAARLARARARLRVAYLLEHGQVALATPRCRAVLEALSAGDRRRQERLDAARHLSTCPTCSTYGEALAARRRALVGLNPLAWIAVASAAGWRAARRQPVTLTTVAVTAAVVGTVGVVQLTASDPVPRISAVASPPTSPEAGSLRIAGLPVLPNRPGPPLPTGTATGRDLVVVSVPADEGFWVGTGPGEQVWVQLVATDESAATVRPGDRVSFLGEARRADADAPSRFGLSARDGAGELRETALYVEVAEADLVVSRR